MGDIADNWNEQGEDMWFDHLAGHPNYPDECPYCDEEYKKEKQDEKNTI